MAQPTASLESPLRFWALATLLLAMAAWARLTDHQNVFTPSGVELQPTDSHYYVRFAQLQGDAFPRFVAHDSYVNHPQGAQILWPPLHTWAVRAAVGALGRDDPEWGAAWTGPLLSVGELILLTWLARRVLGAKVALGALFLMALTPVAVFVGALGNADHHVHEPFFVAVVGLLMGRALQERTARAALAAGMVLGLGRLFTPSAFQWVPLIAAAVPLAALLARPQAAAFARLGVIAGLSCALTLGLAVLGWGRPRSFHYEELSLFQPIFAASLFLAASALAGWMGGRRRWLGAGVAAAAGVALLLPELGRASGALLRGDPLIQLVAESQPLWHRPRWIWVFLGVAGPTLPIALWGVARAVGRPRQAPPESSQRLSLVPLLISGLGLTLSALLQARFLQPLMGAVAVLVPVGLGAWVTRATGRTRWALVGALALGAVTFLAQLQPSARRTTPTDEALVRSTMRWLREHTPAPGTPPRYGVIASHDFGHLLTLWAQRPAVATPFSQSPWHQAGNARAAEVLGAYDDEFAYQAARATQGKYLVVVPFSSILGRPELDLPRTLGRRLLDHAGLDQTSTGHFRLVFESEEQRRRPEGGSYARVFEVVPGAHLQGHAEPGQWVQAELEVQTREGPRPYRRRTRVDSEGRYALRLAYPGAYGLTHGRYTESVRVEEREVREGSLVQGPEWKTAESDGERGGFETSERNQ